MGKTDILLKPFEKWFRPPVIETPFSTIKLPPSTITIPILFGSFFVICSGTIFCYVRNMPMVGAVRTRDGKLISSWIDYGSLSNQFLAEGLVASLFFTVSASSIIAAIYIININSNKPLTEIQQLIKLFGYSSPVWIFFSFLIFKAKIPSFSPSFSSR